MRASVRGAEREGKMFEKGGLPVQAEPVEVERRRAFGEELAGRSGGAGTIIKAQPKALHGESSIEALRAEQEGYVARSVVGIEILEHRAPVRWQRDLDPSTDRPAKARPQK